MPNKEQVGTETNTMPVEDESVPKKKVSFKKKDPVSPDESFVTAETMDSLDDIATDDRFTQKFDANANDDEVEFIAVMPGVKMEEQIRDTVRRDVEQFVCRGCGNTKELCHDQLFGKTLFHDAITYYQNHDDDEVTESHIEHDLCCTYQILLRHYCLNEFGIYDTKV